MLAQGAAGRFERLVHNISDLTVDLSRNGLGIAAALGKIAPQEGFSRLRAVNHRPHALGEAVPGNHGAGGLGGAFQVVGGACGDIVQHQQLRHAAAQQAHDPLLHGGLGHIAGVLIGQIHGVAARSAPGDNADLVHRVVGGAIPAGNGVARLVIRGKAFFLLGNHAALFLGAGHHLDGRLLDLFFRDGLFAPAGGQQGRLVHQVFQVGTRKAHGGLGNGFQVYVRRKGLFAGVHPQDLLAALHVRQAYIHRAVKPARAQQRVVQDVGAVGGGNHDHALVGAKAVHLHQHLVQGLLPLVVPAAQAGAALAAHGVDLVDENNAGGGLFRFFKQIAHAGGAHAHIHLHKVGAGDGVEGHARLARTGPGQQRFAGTRGAHQQYAVGNARTQAVELAGVFQKLHDLFQLGLFLVRTRHIGKGGLALFLALVLHLGAAHIHDIAALAAPVHGVEHKDHAAHQHNHHQDLKPGHAGLGLADVVDHGRVGVGRVVLVHIILHMGAHKQVQRGQLVAHMVNACAAGQHRLRLLAAQHGGQKPLLGLLLLGGAGGLLRIFGQLHGPLFQGHSNDAGVLIQLERHHLVVFEIAQHF